CLAARVKIPYELAVRIESSRGRRASTAERGPMLPEEDGLLAVVPGEPESRPGGIPLYVWVLGAVALAIPVGLYWGEGATRLNLMPNLIIRAIGALAAPLVVLAILSAIVSNDIRGRQGALMMFYYLINTLVAM